MARLKGTHLCTIKLFEWRQCLFSVRLYFLQIKYLSGQIIRQARQRFTFQQSWALPQNKTIQPGMDFLMLDTKQSRQTCDPLCYNYQMFVHFESFFILLFRFYIEFVKGWTSIFTVTVLTMDSNHHKINNCSASVKWWCHQLVFICRSDSSYMHLLKKTGQDYSCQMHIFL